MIYPLERYMNRLRLRLAALLAGFGFGKRDDEHACFEECGLRFKKQMHHVEFVLYCEDVGKGRNIDLRVAVMREPDSEDVEIASRVSVLEVLKGLHRLKSGMIGRCQVREARPERG